jgi:hypothetical protein
MISLLVGIKGKRKRNEQRKTYTISSRAAALTELASSGKALEEAVGVELE